MVSVVGQVAAFLTNQFVMDAAKSHVRLQVVRAHLLLRSLLISAVTAGGVHLVFGYCLLALCFLRVGNLYGGRGRNLAYIFIKLLLRIVNLFPVVLVDSVACKTSISLFILPLVDIDATSS